VKIYEFATCGLIKKSSGFAICGLLKTVCLPASVFRRARYGMYVNINVKKDNEEITRKAAANSVCFALDLWAFFSTLVS